MKTFRAWLNGLFSRDDLTGTLARGVLSASGINAAGIVLAFAAQFVLARALGAESYGIYALLLAWVTLLSLLASFGLQTAVMRLIPEYQETAQNQALAGLLRFSGVITRIGGLVFWAIGALIVTRASGLDEMAQTFLIGLLAVPLMASLRLRGAKLRGFGRVARAMLPDIVLRELVVLTGISFVWWLAPQHLNAVTAGIMLVLASLLGDFLAAVWLRLQVPVAIRTATARTEAKAWMALALPLLFMAGSQIILKRTDVIMLGLLADAKSAGIYNIAARAAELVTFPLMAVNAVLAPVIARLHVNRENIELQAQVTRTARWSFTAAAIIGAPLALLALPLLGLFGAEYGTGAHALQILVGCQLINAGMGSVGFLMTMTGHEGVAARAFALAAFINICLNAALIPVFGISGAAMATGVSIVAWNLVLGRAVWSRLAIMPGAFGGGLLRPVTKRSDDEQLS